MPTVIGGTPGVGGIIPGKTISTYQGSGGDGPSSLTRDEYNDLSLRTFNRVNNSNAGVSAWEHIARYGAGVAIDTADTMWSSPLNPFGERGDLWSQTSPEMQEYYERNKGLIEGSSAVVGGITTAVAAEALLIPKISGALASSTALTGTGAWRAARAWNVMSRMNMLRAQAAAAEAGEAYGLLSSQTGRAFLANRSVAGVAGAVRTAPLEYGVMWNNEAFNSKEASKEGFWIGVAAATGGAFGAVGARAAVRRFANSQEVRDLRAKPYSLSGVSNDLLSDDYLDHVSKIERNGIQLNESAMLTETLVASRSANPAGYDQSTRSASQLSAVRSYYADESANRLQKIITKGIDGVKTVKMAVGNITEAKAIAKETAKRDPLLFHGMASGGFIEEPIADVRKSRADHIESMQKEADVLEKKGLTDKAQLLNRQSRALKMQDDYTLVNGSWMDPESDLAVAATAFDPQAIKDIAIKHKDTETIAFSLPHTGNSMHIDASLTPTQGGKPLKNIQSMSLKDRFMLDGVANLMVKKLTAKNAKVKFALTDKDAESNWYALDLAAEVLRGGGQIEWKTKNFKLANIDDIQRQSLRIKANKLLAQVGETGAITPELRFRYNLPAQTAMEGIEDASGDTFRMWLGKAAGDEGTPREMALALGDSRAINGLDILPPPDAEMMRLDGNNLRFNRNEDGEWLRPMYAYFNPKSQIEPISRQAMSDAMTLRKAEKTFVLMKNDTHVGELANQLVASPELRQAMDIAGLHEDQVTGIGGVGQVVGEMLPQRHLARDNPAILAASKLQEATEKHGLNVYRNMMEQTGMQDIVTRVTSSGHGATRTMLDQYFSLRSGWDIDEVALLEDGLYGFLLKDTEANRMRLGMAEGEEWDKGTYMPNERMNQPIVVNDDALATIKAYGQLTDATEAADNVLRNSKGMDNVNHKSFYTPPPNTNDALVAWVFDQADQMVPGRAIVARNQEEYNQLYKRTLADLGPNSGYSIKTREQLRATRGIWDDAGMDWLDPGVTAATAGLGPQSGKLTGAYVRQGAFNEALEWIKAKAITQSQETLRGLMDETLLYARARGAAQSVNAGQKAGEETTRNIWHVYEKNLLGGSKGYTNTSRVDAAFKGVEKRIDAILADSSVGKAGRWVVDLAQRLTMDPKDLSGAKTFKQIAERMGPYTPFKSAMEFMETRGVRPPPTMKGISTTLNTIAASVLLRYFELPHALMNGLGLIATMPAAVFSGKAPISTFIDVKGQRIPAIDGAKIMAQGMKDMFTKRAGADWEHMLKMGDTSQSVMEYHQALGAIQSQAGFMKWAKNADKYASIISEKSEQWSRQVAHFVGLRVADYHGIEGMAARHNFAREIANSMIADYAPINRPEMFSSGFGGMIGLFQSYGLNHYSKMFRWMENGEYAKMGIQAGMQAVMFGVPGTYGFGQLMDFRDSMLSSGSDPTALDLIYEHYGPTLGGAIAHGGVSQFTRLAMWSRGDTNFRVPGMSGTLAPLEIGTKVARGAWDGVAAFMNAAPGGGAHAMMETVQREMPNRVLKSWLTLMNGGREIDSYGQVMSDTQTWMDIAARTVGLRSTRQQSELEAYYAGKGAMERDAAKMDKLRQSFRSEVRRANGDYTKLNPMGQFNDYVAAGGNPRLFGTWVKDLIRNSDSPRAQQALKQSLTTPKSALETWRYGAYGAWSIRDADRN